MNFKKWYYAIQEVGTGTNCVAVFSRPIFGADLVQRNWPPTFGEDKDKEKEKTQSPKNK